MILAATALLAGCSEYHSSVRVCELDPAVPAPWGAGGAYRTISRECASALAKIPDLDWGDFGESPHVIAEPESPSDYVVGGLYALLAHDGQTADAFRAELVPGEFAHENGLIGSAYDSEGEFWANVVSGISPLTYHPVEDCILAFDAYSLVYACDLSALEAGGKDAESLSPVGMASVLIHEAVHVYAPRPHLSSPACVAYDADWTGAFGAQARWLDGWIRQWEGVADPLDVALANEKLDISCGRIANLDGFPPCQGRKSVCAE